MTTFPSPLHESTEQSSSPKNTPSSLIERSLLAMLFAGFLLSLLVGIALLMGTASVRAQPRTVMLVGYGVFLATQIGGIGWLLTMPQDRFKRTVERIATLLGGGWSLLIMPMITVLVFIAIPVINGVVPVVQPLSTLLLGGLILALVLIALANADAIQDWVSRARRFWLRLGLGITLVSVLVILYVLTNLALDSARVIDRLRGGVDFRELIFYGNDIDPARSQAYWVELGELQAQWVSYTYSRMSPFTGAFINIDTRGLRQTVNPTLPAGAPRVFFFGGSTMWGEGSRDAYTIPSQTADLLAGAGSPAEVTNFGQVAYVSTQDLIVFERQLALGNIPDAAVFYGGFNDIASVTISDGIAGLPHNEVNRVRDLAAGSTLRTGRPVLRPSDAALNALDLSLVGIPHASPEQIAALWLANARLIRAAAREYGVNVLFVWQPSILFKQTLSEQEQLFAEQNRQTVPGFDELYQAVDAALRAQVSEQGLDDVLILSDLFADETRYLFYDRVHVIEDGNTLIAGAMLDAIQSRLE